MSTHNSNGLGNVPPLSSPGQGIFQSIGLGYSTLTKLFDAVDHIEDRLSGKVVASVMDPSHGLTPVAAAELRQQRLFHLLGSDSIVRQYLDFAVQNGLPPNLEPHLLTMVADFSCRTEERVRQEMGTAFERALVDADLYGKCSAIKDELDVANAALKAVEDSWRAVQGSESSGRAAFAVRRDVAIQKWVESTTKNNDVYRRMALLEGSIRDLMNSAEASLTAVQGNVALLNDAALKRHDEHHKMRC